MRNKVLLIAVLALALGLYLKKTETVVPKQGSEPQRRPQITSSAAGPIQTTVPPPRIPATADEPQGLTDWLSPYQSKSGLHIRTGPEGQVTVVSGIKYPSHWKSIEDGLAFARQFAARIGIPEEQIVVAKASPPETDVNDVFRYAQVYSGYPIFGGFLQVTQSKSTGESYLIGNELKVLGNPQLENNLSSSQAEDVLKTKFGSSIEILAEKNSQQIFASGRGKSELTWAYSIEIYRPGRDRRFVLVSANDGKIVFDQSLVVH